MKRDNVRLGDRVTLSHPARVRGLKLLAIVNMTTFGSVAPRAGAWIETLISGRMKPMRERRTPRGCVD